LKGHNKTPVRGRRKWKDAASGKGETLSVKKKWKVLERGGHSIVQVCKIGDRRGE